MTGDERTCDECNRDDETQFDQLDGRLLCRDCSPAGECKRCGRRTQATTLDGDYLCNYCQDHRQDQHETRAADQHGLGEWAE